MEKVPFTKSGLVNLKAELNDLKKIQRPDIIKAIQVAREHGDLSENAEYHAAKEKQSFIEGRITELESVLSRAEIIDLSKLNESRVTFGTKVKVYDENSNKEINFSIVGPYEANLEKGLISISSPIARALLSKEKGSRVEVNTPSGLKNYEILDINILN